jgi:hypothetical protein
VSDYSDGAWPRWRRTAFLVITALLVLWWGWQARAFVQQLSALATSPTPLQLPY